jgi:DNA adenine methylase
MLAPWVLKHVPACHETYIEPYSGSAAVLLRKERSLIEVFNDMDGEVVNFFRVLREDPAPLIRAIELTPFAKAEWELSYQPDPDPIEQARRFYVRAYMSIAGATAQWNTGWRRQKVFSRGSNGRKMMTPAAVTFMKTEHLYQVANRLRGVIIESDNALSLIGRYDSPNAFFYIDPPYVLQTRGRWSGKAYAHEMDDSDHCELADALANIDGLAIVSGYACGLYTELYEAKGWQRVDRRTRINGPGHAIESLWLSPRVASILERGRPHEQLPLLLSSP